MAELNLGIIGLSDGNGHPYSWSAICNGYNQDMMAACPFPGIPKYLAAERWPDAQIQDAFVSHVWTQDRQVSDRIASSSLIPNVLDEFEDMIGLVDGVLLARDDYQNHLEFASPFLKAGLPVYVDKPIANSVVGAQALFEQQLYEGQIFTCSALRYSRKLEALRGRISDIAVISAVTPKSWSKYSIHIIEPVISLFPHLVFEDVEVLDRKVCGEKVDITCRYREIDMDFSSTNDTQSSIHFVVTYKDGASETIVMDDYFHCFKSALLEFVGSISTKAPVIAMSQTLCCIEFIESGKTQ